MAFKKKNESSPWPPVRSDAWPNYIDGRKPILCWIHPDGHERVFLVQRSDGSFTFEHQYFSDHEYEMCWLMSGRGGSIYDSAETATREIEAEHSWAKETIPEKKAEFK